MFFYVGSYFISFCVRVCFWLTVCFIVYLSTEEHYCYLVKSSLLSSCMNWIHSQCLQLSSMKSIMHLWWYNLIIHVALCFLASSSKENNAFFFFFILPFLSLLLQLQFRMLVLKENIQDTVLKFMAIKQDWRVFMMKTFKCAYVYINIVTERH